MVSRSSFEVKNRLRRQKQVLGCENKTISGIFHLF